MLTDVQAAELGRTVLPGHVPPGVASQALTAKSRVAATNRLALSLGFPLSHAAELDALLDELYQPGSPRFHQFLAPAEFARRFGPAPADYQQVIDFIQTNHLQVERTYSNRLVLDVSGSVAEVENAFHVTLYRYAHPTEAREFFAPAVDPSVPAGLNVLSIEGLSDFSLPRHSRLQASATRKPAAFNGTGPGQQYAGNDFRNAYVPGTALNGAGQSVAVLEYSDYYPVDITNYENIVGATIGATNYVPLVKVLVGRNSPSTANNIEVALDIEMALSMAPMLAQVYVYEDASSSSSLLSRIAADNLAKQVSSSWTVGSWSSTLATTYDNILKNMAAQGQSYFQASGDGDAYTGTQPLDSGTTAPADSPYATVVGGTTLAMNGSGASWASESVWNYNLNGIPNEGSGGGISTYYAQPAWQTNINMAGNSGSSTRRNIPDVALTADDIFIAYDNGVVDGGSYAMGTSAAAPLWAGFCALANQFSVANRGTVLGFLNPALYNIAISSCYRRCFHDITSGNNIGTNTAGLFNAVAGYDLCTGLGTPTGTNLINALVWPPPQFTNQPASQTVMNGVNVTLIGIAASTTPISYFWLCGGTNLSASSNVAGVATNALVLTAVTANNGGRYQLVASNFTGSVTSQVAVLNVGSAPAVSVSPASRTLLAGGTTVFTATGSGTAPLGFTWKKNGTNFAGANISGTNIAVLTLASVTTNSAASYAVVVTNLFGSVTSSVSTLTVVLPPTITSSSVTNRTIQCGSNVLQFTATAAGTPPLSYQWSVDGAPITGAASSTFSLTNLHLPNHTISVQITNLYAAVASNAVLTVVDTIPATVRLNGANPLSMELGAAFLDPGATATNPCFGPLSVSVSGLVNTNVVGTNLLQYLANDGNGSSNTATRTVIVRDTTPPAITWSVTNLVLAAGTDCTAVLPDLTATNYAVANDLSGVASLTQSPTNGAALPLGTNWVILTATDLYGNIAASTNQVVVQDQTPPVLVVNGANPLTNELGAAWVDPGISASDDCSGIAQMSTNGTVNTGAVGSYVLTYVAVDGSGNTNLALRTVIVQDTTPPAITWNITNLVLTAGADCTAVLPDLTATNYAVASDWSGVASLTQSPTNGAALPLGTNWVVLTATDSFGNTAASTNQVLVQDQTPPVLVVNGANLLTNELGAAWVDPGISASDDCSGIAQMSTNGTVNTGAVGSYVLTYVAVDGSGNTNLALRTVVVQDTTPPAIMWNVTNLVLTAGTDCTAVLPDLTATNYAVASDWSGVASLTQSPTNGAALPLGTNWVILTATDSYGNTAAATNEVVVQDQTPPVLVVNGANPLTNELGAAWVDPGVSASDDCSGIAQLSTNGTVNVNVAGIYTLIYVALDGSGNSNTAARTVIVPGATPLTILWSFTNLVLAANSDCAVVLPDLTATNYLLALDLSGPITVTQSPTNGAILALGTNQVMLIIEDPEGNLALSTNQVVVQDQTPPNLVVNGLNPMPIELGAAFVDPGVTASDDCSGIAQLSTNGTVNSGFVGTYSVTYAAVDGSGNSNSVTRTVVVQDTTPPTILWSFTNLVLAANADCAAIQPDLTGTNHVLAVDLSGDVIVSQSPTNGALLALGTNQVILAVADATGNTAYSTNTVVVQDQAVPQIVAQPQGQTNVVGGVAAFSVVASACTPLSYQWISNSMPLLGQTNNILELPNLDFSAAAAYGVVVSSAGGSVTSSVAALAVVVAVPPAIAQVAINPAGSVALNLSGMPGLTYILEAATNLSVPVSWFDLATNTLGLDGQWFFTDLQAPNYPQQYYRLRLAP